MIADLKNTSPTLEERNALPYRPCVGIVLFNKDGRVFAGERINSPNAWQMPQGGIDAGETIEQAALRELAEEIGTNHVTLIETMPDPVRYDLPLEICAEVWAQWGNQKFRGQEQFWVSAQFKGDDADINLSPPDHPAEFFRWKWVDLPDLIDLIVPFKRDIYRQVIAYFSK
jgi:putative (di)nucleoside polyphosphate hydrolase